MAYDVAPTIVSFPAGTTFAASDIGKAVVVNASGQVVVPNTTGNILPQGVLYGRTSTTSAGEAVPVALLSGIVKVRMSASTLSAGDFIAASTNGFWGAGTTDSYIAGKIVSGSSGGIRLVSAELFVGPLSAV